MRFFNDFIINGDSMGKGRESIRLLFQNGLQYYNQGDHQRCLACCDAILHSDRRHHEACNLAGLALFAIGNTQKSLEMLNYAYTFSQREDYLVNIAEILRRIGKVHEALQIMQKIQDHHIPHYYYNLAKIYTDLHDDENAKKCYDILLEQNPDDKEALFNLGNLFSWTNPALAQEYYEKSYQLGLLDAGINLASLLSRKDLLQESLALYKELAKKARSAEFFFNYANTLGKLTYTDKESFKICKQYFKKSLEIQETPYTAMNYSQLLIRFGEIKEGFKMAEARFGWNIMPPALRPFYVKPNTKLDGKRLLVYDEQGFGDTILFARFLPQMATKVGELTLVVQPPLLRLFVQGFLGIVNHKNIVLLDEIPRSGFDYALALPSLPFMLKVSSPSDFACLPAPQLPTKRKHKKLKIGFCYASSKENPLSSVRDIPLERLIEALAIDGVELVSLQYSPSEHEQKILQKAKIKDIGSTIADFADTQAELLRLDVLVSVDTAIVHLAASLGVRTCVLLYKYYDWRYEVIEGRNLLYGESLYRFVQKDAHNWDSVFIALRAQLEQWRAQ